MALPTFGDALTMLQVILSAAHPAAEINILEDQAAGFTRGLSVGSTGRPTHMAFLQESGGQTLDHLLLDRVRVEVVTYSYGPPSTGRAFAREIQRSIVLAVNDQVTTPDGHMRFINTDVRPYVQQLQGIPTTITRTSATYSIGLRSRVA